MTLSLIFFCAAHSALAQQTPAPRGAFLGGGAEEGGMSSIWFWVGLYVLAGLVFGALSAHRALQTGNRALLWFFVGFLFALPGYLLLLTRPKQKMSTPAGVPAGLKKIGTTYEAQPCPGCGEMNHPAASECIGCGGKLTPRVASEVERAGLHHD